VWGNGVNGRLGNGTTTDRSSPVQVGTLSNWKQISSGAAHTGAIKTDGTLWMWGLNNDGQLGDGTVVSKSSPIQIGTGTNWKQICLSKTGYYTLAIKTDGTLWAWGINANISPHGNLGLGDIVHRSSPVQIGSLTNWKQVSAGEVSAHAISAPELP
jgi:alpha-tubulin suppressor-like RCC1 family protein